MGLCCRGGCTPPVASKRLRDEVLAELEQGLQRSRERSRDQGNAADPMQNSRPLMLWFDPLESLSFPLDQSTPKERVPEDLLKRSMWRAQKLK
jgi:hypothetical protein